MNESNISPWINQPNGKMEPVPENITAKVYREFLNLFEKSLDPDNKICQLYRKDDNKCTITVHSDKDFDTVLETIERLHIHATEYILKQGGKSLIQVDSDRLGGMIKIFYTK